ncbi:hypothetical protein Zmor_024857 [Zophobas morio]|uniref:Uncharacterized protein n=1 Tax=Zophobas morio TaxID=2755281 RepID=A0AA38M4C5_9CUCU|nr:hypothetical protein Zmor_024857 [Zophobas morio]
MGSVLSLHRVTESTVTPTFSGADRSHLVLASPNSVLRTREKPVDKCESPGSDVACKGGDTDRRTSPWTDLTGLIEGYSAGTSRGSLDTSRGKIVRISAPQLHPIVLKMLPAKKSRKLKLC